jgi:GNAT superfamily N-acetyltransferase
MDIQYRASDRSNSEFQYIAEIDSRIPLEFDSHFHWTEAHVQKRLADYKLLKATDFIHVAIADGKIVGFHILKEAEYGSSTMGNVVTLWTDPKFRKKGIATKLKELATDWAKKRKVKFIQTAVHVNNKAMLDLNKKLNFEDSYRLLRKYL